MLVGDTHGNNTHLEYILREASKKQIDLIIQLGDWGYTWPSAMPRSWNVFKKMVSKAGIPFWFLAGNHDNYDWIETVTDGTRNPQQIAPLVTYLPRAATFEAAIDDLKFMAVGGGVSIDKEPSHGWGGRKEHVSWWSQELITDEDVEAAKKIGKVDILLTHDSPDNLELSKFLDLFTIPLKMDNLSKSNRQQLNIIMDNCKPSLVVHGHYHMAYTYQDQYLRGPKFVGLDHDGTGRNSYMILDTQKYREALDARR